MKLTDEQLGSLLVDSGLLTEEESRALAREVHTRHKPLRELLIEQEKITDKELGALLADAQGYPFVYLADIDIPEDVLKIIPEAVASAQRLIAFARDRSGIKVASTQPDNLEALNFLAKRTGERILPYYATQDDLARALARYRQQGTVFAERLDLLTREATQETGGNEEASVIKLVDHILQYGFENHASDIHIEPHEKETVIRLRIDGILHDVGTFPPTLHARVVARVKVLARMRLDEHFSAQDGRFQIHAARTPVDIRVSIVPITKGEKVVLRLLSEHAQRFGLEDLGFSHENYAVVRRNLTQPWGMMLATGPTGSGKTTTLYAMLKILNSRGVNISTIEDPVEYDIEGVNQIQVNSKTNLTFASGLRAIVRQNPDIIMVGEIRDGETAGIAVNAAMTGHLVLSTLHTNDAATAIPRLTDMGIELFLIASSVNLVIAQRLVRKICMQCIESYPVKRAEFEREHPDLSAVMQKMYKSPRGDYTFYRGKECQACAHTGYRGRIGIFEVLEITDAVRTLIRKRSDADEIRETARQEGMTTLLEDGIAKVIAGVTTLEEVLRVTREEEA